MGSNVVEREEDVAAELAALTWPELLDQASSYSSLLGEVSGIRFAAESIRQMSGEFFAKGDDEAAKGARKLAHIIEGLANEKRKEYDEHYAKNRAKLWEEVDRRVKTGKVRG